MSSAARRIFRQGPARTALARAGAADAANVIPLANRCPPDPEENPKGLPHANTAAAEHGLPLFDDMIGIFLGGRPLEDRALVHLLEPRVSQAPQEVQDIFNALSFFAN